VSKRHSADDSDYNPATDSETQSSAEGSVSLDAEDAHSHLDCHTRFSEDKPNANHVRARIRNSRTQRLHK
jgi:hypothetical protein